MLEQEGVVEVSPFFLLPDVARTQNYRGRRHEVRLRYPVQVELVPDGRPAYLRSHGAGFHIVPVEWLASDLTRVYSIGPGLGPDGDEVLVLLAQCFDAGGRTRTLADAVGRFTSHVIVDEQPEYGLPCFRLSAAFDTTRYPLCADARARRPS